jgi:hypothetical protein
MPRAVKVVSAYQQRAQRLKSFFKSKKTSENLRGTRQVSVMCEIGTEICFQFRWLFDVVVNDALNRRWSDDLPDVVVANCSRAVREENKEKCLFTSHIDVMDRRGVVKAIESGCLHSVKMSIKRELRHERLKHLGTSFIRYASAVNFV